ncbi:hypothetical protein ABZY57_04345 [Streptomyces sp. NPDC006450]|uniref:hypothetical protein n=1 Tax=Streptomyces sp. NPDC006450 TaxID=3155458 RepID=UPI0033AE11A3
MTHRRATARAPRSLAALLALTLPLTAAAWLAEPATASAAESGSVGGDAEAAGAQKSASEAEAFALARETSQRVEIIDRREESVETFANPDGTLTRRQYAAPAWTRYDRTWKKADATVVEHPDGTVGPAAPVFGITFSGGGTTLLAAMAKGDKKLALSWPTALPKPVLDGTTALYKSVLPDVDLKVIAGTDGFAEHLIVNTPQAARNPALKSIKLGITTQGVTLADDAGDNLTAKDAAGNIIFSAPRPTMWEQPPADPSPAASSSPATKNLSFSTAADAPPAVQSAPVAVEVSGTSLTLTPNAALLAGADQFPLVIDPPFDGGSREKWATVYDQYPNEAYPNGSGWHSDTPADEPRVGYNGTGNTRAFFAMDATGLKGATILDATFAVEETHSWGCDPAAAGWTELWSATDISTTPTWNSQSSYWGHVLASDSYAHGNPTYCPGVQGHDYHSNALTNYVQEAATKGWDPLVFGLRTDNAHLGDRDSFKRFRNNPVLEVDYNFKPTVDASKAYEGHWVEGGDGNKEVPCTAAIGNSALVMTAEVTDKDLGQVVAIFKVNNSAGEDVPFPNNYMPVSSGDTAFAKIPTTSLSNGNYFWRVYAQDSEGTTSASTPWCSFKVDQVGPADPVTVTVPGPDGKPVAAATATYQARTPSTFTLSNTATDLAGFCWAMHSLTVSNTRCPNGNWVPVTAGTRTATITAEPTWYPSTEFHALAYDTAGNHSPVGGGVDSVTLTTTKAEFVYGPGKNPGNALLADQFGDLNGDGYPDLLATDTNANLLLYPGDGTGKLGDSSVARRGAFGSGVLVAHGGDFTGMDARSQGDGYEDYVVRSGGGSLYLFAGNGQGELWLESYRTLARPSASGTTDWKRTQQMITPGDIDRKTATGYANGNDLLTIECADGSNPCTNGELWLYSGMTRADGKVDQTKPFDIQNRVKLGWGWQAYTNLSLGDLNGDGIKDLVSRNSADGKLYLYPGKVTNGVYSLGDRALYGSGGWAENSRPHITSPGNIQGTVVSMTYTDPDNPNNPIPYRQFRPKTGEAYGDWWATTPADASVTVGYVDDSGAAKTTTSSTGCLLFYAGGPAAGRSPRLLGCGGWDTYITNIF